jgi:hypothetical protein
MNKGNLSSTLIVLYKSGQGSYTNDLCFSSLNHNFYPFLKQPVMKQIRNILFFVLAICASNDLPAQVTDAKEISLIPHHTQHDVPNALRGVNQTANSNINWTDNTEFLDEFTAKNLSTFVLNPLDI